MKWFQLSINRTCREALHLINSKPIQDSYVYQSNTSRNDTRSEGHHISWWHVFWVNDSSRINSQVAETHPWNKIQSKNNWALTDRSLSPIVNTSSSAHHVPSQLYTSTIASFQQGNIISSMILNTTCFYFPLHLTMKNSLYPDNNSSPLTIFILFTGWKRECYKPLWYVSCVFQYGVLHSRVYVLYVNHSLPSTCIQFLEVNPYSVVELYQKIKTHQVCLPFLF